MFRKLKARERFISLIYPPACVLCKKILSKEEVYVCRDCKVKPEYIYGTTCMKCGKEIDNPEEEYCLDCQNHKRSFDRGFPAMRYKEPITNSLWEFKYNNLRSHGKYFAREIVKARGKDIVMVAPDVLVPVPIHKNKLYKRGYNQAQILAEELGEILKIPVDSYILERKINTLPQKELDNLGREKNLKRAFVCSDKIVKYNKVMLVDDIYTTGATIEACSNALKQIGIKQVYYTSVCIGRSN